MFLIVQLCFFTRRSELLLKRVCSFFSVLLVSSLARLVLITVFGLSLVSTSAEHVRQKRGTVSFFLVSVAVSFSLCCFVFRAQIEKCSRISFVFGEPVQELSYCQPIRKTCCVVRIIHKSSIGVVLRDPGFSHRHRLVNCRV